MNTLRELFRHHTWATLTLLDHCRSLPSAALDETAPGTYGSLLETFVHLVGGDQRYLSRLPGAEPQLSLPDQRDPSLAELRVLVQEQAQRWEALLDLGDSLQVTMPAQADGWPETAHAETLMMLQTLHHGNEHRAHICTILGANGRTAPEIGGWDYWESVHLPRT